MSRFWLRAVGRAANVMTLAPSTGAFLQGKRSTFRLKPVWQGASYPPERRRVDQVESVAVAAGPDQREAVVGALAFTSEADRLLRFCCS
jgi:hypothetical protein